ncbi:MAG: hypothetical protein D6735_01775 [Acidobacteria bacterium]|nr:MAG: hypothetical protein D6735_01775 [Acidobacteriota bacterium]
MRKLMKQERGSTMFKFILILIALILIVHAGWVYISALYQSESIKQEMQTAVLQGSALPPGQGKGNPVDIVKDRLRKAAAEYELPPDTYIEVKPVNNVLQARVYYKKQINLLPFGLWKYDYVFDKTVAPTGFLTK